MPTVARVGGGATAATLVFCVWLLSGSGSPALRLAVEDVLFVVLAAFVTGCCAHAARRSRPGRGSVWAYVTVGMVGYTVGSVIWAYHEWWQGVSPFPSAADVAYLMLPVFVCIGLLRVPTGASGYTRGRLALDGFIVAVAFFQIGWWTLMDQLFSAGGSSRFAVGRALAYPVLDLGVLTVAVLVVGRARADQRRSLSLLVAGMTLMTLADGVFVYTNTHDNPSLVTYGSVGWASGLLLIGLAALCSEHAGAVPADGDHKISRAAFWLPYVPIVVAMGLALSRFAETAGLPPALIASALLIILVLMRQLIVVGENRKLLETVAAQAMRAPSAPVDDAAALQMLGQLRRAIDNSELTLAYQPKFDLDDDSIVGVEALVRWPHPERGLLGPDQFLQLVREHGLMRPINDLVLDQALDQVAAWLGLGFRVPVAVNVFAPSLADPGLPDRVEQALRRRGLPYDILTIEITEDLLIDHRERTAAVITRLRHNGIRVAIDDFGSGFSALSYLRDLRVDELKLDRAFVTAIVDDRTAAVIVRSVIDLAGELGLTTVAEGVESDQTAVLLRSYGCPVGQGFVFSEPLPPQEMLALLRSRRREPDAAISN